MIQGNAALQDFYLRPKPRRLPFQTAFWQLFRWIGAVC